MKLKKWIWPALFAAGGALAGLAYYTFFGCKTSCPISSSPVNTMLYVGVIGLLLSGVFRRPAGF